MPAARIRADYEQLNRISQIFARQSSALTTVNRKVKSAQQTLQSGDWIGQGAKVFQNEMNSQVNPSMDRLQKAMEQAAQITKKIHDIMKQAEDEAKNCFTL